MTTKRRNVYRCEWCRGEVTEDIEYVPSCGDRGYCEVCGQTVTLLERRELLPEQARVERDDSEAAESSSTLVRAFVGGGGACGLERPGHEPECPQRLAERAEAAGLDPADMSEVLASGSDWDGLWAR